MIYGAAPAPWMLRVVPMRAMAGREALPQVDSFVNLRGDRGERAESGDREGRPRLSASPGAAESLSRGGPGSRAVPS